MVQPNLSNNSSPPVSPTGSSSRWLEAEKTVLDYIQSLASNNHDTGMEFHLPGWRWHYLSLIRESKRLQKLALREHSCVNIFVGYDDSERSEDEHLPALKDAVDYVVGFNMKALHRIENELYFPLLRQKIYNKIHDPTIVEAFEFVLDRWECKQQSMAALGSDLGKTLAAPLEEVSSESLRLASLIQRLGAFVKHLDSLFYLQREMLIPIMAALVPPQEQKSLTPKVTRVLGILDSRIHFVGYYMAILDEKEEQKIWLKHIPAIPRSMIPLWKRSLYDARTHMLEQQPVH